MIVTLDALLVQAMWHSTIQLQTFPNDGKHEAVKPKQVKVQHIGILADCRALHHQLQPDSFISLHATRGQLMTKHATNTLHIFGTKCSFFLMTSDLEFKQSPGIHKIWKKKKKKRKPTC